jgi:hypothetical protein
LEKVIVRFVKPTFYWLLLHGPGGPTGFGIEVEFPFILLVALLLVALPVALPAIVLPLVVWLLCIIVCACADILPKLIAASVPGANTPTANIVTANLNMLFILSYINKVFI